MPYRRPSFIPRVIFNRLAMLTGISGVKTLSIRKRRSGELQRIPVLVLEHEGERYLVSPRGECDWVKNLRAAGGEGELSSRKEGTRFLATEVPVSERPPLLEAYKKLAGKAVSGHFKALPDPADHPVFRI